MARSKAKSSKIFAECVARVPVSLLGFRGWWCVRSTLRLCSQPFATVRNRPQPSARGPYGRAYGKFCKRGHFWRFHMSRCFVSRGRRGTSWHSKIILCGRHNTFATCSKDALQFSWQARHFGCVHRGRRSALECRVAWFLRIALSGLRQVATRCKFRGRRGVLWDVMKIDEASQETSVFR